MSKKDMANEWLKENDPDYGCRHKLEHSYLTGRQINERAKREIPISNLTATNILPLLHTNHEKVIVKAKAIQELMS